MNETKSGRYHRLKRRAGALSLAWAVIVLAVLLWLRPALPLWRYVLLLAIVHELVALPLAFYSSFVLERRYDLSIEPFGTWLKDHLKAFAIMTVFALTIAQGVYVVVRWFPEYWWLVAALSMTATTIALARLAPLFLLPLFYKFTPLEQPNLTERLVAMSKRAGVPVLGVYEWALGAKTRRANAALVGSGSTRRILLSDTLLAEYTEDEIEVILAHELAHHVHHDIPKGLALEFFVLLIAFFLTDRVFQWIAPSLGLSGVADVGGLPLLIACVAGVSIVATPVLHAVSRLNERRADRFALALTRQPAPFISAMKRLGAQNLSEENPSRWAVWLFHTHPPIEERIAAARMQLQ